MTTTTEKYTCPCSNVTIEVAIQKKSEFDLNEIQKALINNDNNGEDKGSSDNNELQRFIKQKFLNENTCPTKIRQHTDTSTNSAKIKYQLLTGICKKELSDDHTIELNMCLVCCVVTHSIYGSNKKQDNQNTNALHSSHSDANRQFNSIILVNSKDMILNPDISKFIDAENYSSVYDILLDDKKLVKLFDEFTLKINQVPIFEQRIFLNKIEEKYHTIKSVTEEKLAHKLEDLINYLLDMENNAGKSHKSHFVLVGKSCTGQNEELSGVRIQGKLENKVDFKSIKVKQIPVKYDDENILSSSVFEMEDIDELAEGSGGHHFESDLDSQEEEREDESGVGGNQVVQMSILKKRNSNIGELDNNVTSGGGGNDMQKNNNGSKQILFANNRKDNILQTNQYSCSLPRDIPVMHNRRSSTTNNENYYNPVREQQKHHKQLITNSYKQPNTTYFTSHFNTNPNYPKNNDNNNSDDDIFSNGQDLEEEDNDESAFLDDTEDTSNMGQAISTLASSIVVKDGRELFGGVPSRRVPINSISRSCYE